MKIVWRINLVDGVDEGQFFNWLRANVWASSARYGCTTEAFRIEGSSHAYSTEAFWPDDAARDAWQRSDDFTNISPYPGFGSLWAAQADLERAVYRELSDGS